jgi:hypothetical protein
MFDVFNRVDVDLSAIFSRVLQRHEKDIEALNREQLMKGQKSDGTFLPPYTPAYAKRKGKPLTPKTLRDKGGFQDNIFETFFQDSFNVESNDWKSDILESVWGKKIFGLTKESKIRLLREFGVAEETIREVKLTVLNVQRHSGSSGQGISSNSRNRQSITSVR